MTKAARKASFAKKRAASQKILVPKPQAELRQDLDDLLEQIQFDCERYDQGKHHVAAPLASKLRTLLHNNPNTTSKSLLWQLDLESTDFFDTARIAREDNPNVFVEPASGMAYTSRFEENGQLYRDWCPALDEWNGGTSLGPLKDWRTAFKTWWDTSVTTSKDGKNKFTRSWIIRSVANQDGGAHFAPGIEEKYYQLTREDDYGPDMREAIIDGDAVTHPNVHVAPDRIQTINHKGSGRKIARALVRQVAHEVLVTLLPDPSSYRATLPVPPATASPVRWMQGFIDPTKKRDKPLNNEKQYFRIRTLMQP